ncbi:YiiX/YebB-like N1pC/P60 family cysteine hydrolase [Paenibacillus montanisoli]|uniref:LRAT domain-containing protein n=1 Tax=Paenibacillus montanisoli TaxID=2081970 RepID=A0A328UB76_9BACL|nr:YiiX/YebB-like N1pC/P60 family cysteine hydrolase [Paenibacillus montanisoli]RAP77296.1 hypothetical protein DL346_02020 [Paenibacillus montanisoli]
MRFRQGDAIFILNHSLFSKTVASFGKSKYSHVGMVIEDADGDIVHMVEAKPFYKIRTRRYSLQNQEYGCYRIGGGQSQRLKLAVAYAKQKIGMQYDYWQFINLFSHVVFNKNRALNLNKKWICTSLMDICYFHAGIKRKDTKDIGNITLEELLTKYDFEKVESS